jgi:hypothetical protein
MLRRNSYWQNVSTPLERRIGAKQNAKLKLLDRSELDKFVKESARLSLEEGERKMEELNWNVRVMMKKLRSFYAVESHQGSAFGSLLPNSETRSKPRTVKSNNETQTVKIKSENQRKS